MTEKISRAPLYLLIFCSGLAALSWEVLWQLRASLALGVSALGTALTLASTIGGMSLGAWLGGRLLKERAQAQPLRYYAVLEIVIGLCGLALPAAFDVIAVFDDWAYKAMPDAHPALHIASIVAVLGVPTLCMGATFPLFGLMAQQWRTSIAVLYGLNTIGAAAGTLLVAFLFIPFFGVMQTGFAIAAINVVIGVAAWSLPAKAAGKAAETAAVPTGLTPWAETALAALTGFATFAMEIAWFRTLAAVYTSTTAAFAVMLASVLLALGAAGALVPVLRAHRVALGAVLALAGMLILTMTPLLERFDSVPLFFGDFRLVIAGWFIMTLFVIGPPMMLLGMVLPWIMAGQDTPRRWGKLYAVNTLCAIAGAVGAAWCLLPLIGATRTSWLVGGVVALAGVLLAPRRRAVLAAGSALALAIAIGGAGGVSDKRMIGLLEYRDANPSKILDYYEGPESTIAAVEYPGDRGRALIIDGFMAASHFDPKLKGNDGYMAWMGHLPMLLHANPQQALVICFGTGQTSNAVRRENPAHLDIVDINPRVFKLGQYFPKNENVLADPRVSAIAMDGRSYLRRTDKNYDVITLEPMPPRFAGVNALYAEEFYRLARSRLNNDGIIAQWLPFHLVPPDYMASIVNSFRAVFPNALFWIDPISTTGILLGSKAEQPLLGSSWPGFARNPIARDYDEALIKRNGIMNRDSLKIFDGKGPVITDDNQRLAYGGGMTINQYMPHSLREMFAFLGMPDPSETAERLTIPRQ